MNTVVLNEREFFKQLQDDNKKTFLKLVADYERYIAPILRTQGYKRINQAERTVLFTFGEVTFSRSRWKKNGVTRIPVDEKLGLLSHTRFSQEMIYQLTSLANHMPYRKVAKVMELINQVYINKDNVLSAIKKAGELLEEKEKYQIFVSAEDQEKIKPKILYIEGDGVWIKQKQGNSNSKSKELTHFVVHTGCKSGKRKELENKFECISTSYKSARNKLMDIIYNHFDIANDTVIITNSDLGKGYSSQTFSAIAKAFNPKAHYHFWDGFHVKQAINNQFRHFPNELATLAYQAIRKRDRSQLTVALDTAESLIESEERLEAFQRFRQQVLTNFRFTHRPKDFELPSEGIGIIESQHRKVSYRMKRRGMYWSEKGANIMSKTILMNHEGNLRDLFFGDWRKGYQLLKNSPVSAGKANKKVYVKTPYIRTYKSGHKTGRWRTHSK